jgi:predicted branched-subunit amino acid permease
MTLVPPTFAIAASFGLLARSLDWGIVAPIVFSLITFAGGAQLAVAGVLGGGGTVAAAVVAALLVNTRFIPMSIAVAPSLRGRVARRMLEAQTIIDVSWALASRGDGRYDREMLIGTTIPQYAAWGAGTAAGVLAGGLVGNPHELGLDAIFPAFFLVLVVQELRNGRAIAAAALAAGLALLLIPVAPAGIPVLAASAAALIALVRR